MAQEAIGMFLTSKNEKPYDETTIRSAVWLKCDYCGCEFQRIKKSRDRLNKIIVKDSCGSKSCQAQKKIDVNMELHGVPYLFQSNEFKEHNKKVCLERYGTEQYYSSDDFKTKRKDKLEEKYSVDSPLKNQKIKDRFVETMLNRHGVANPAQMSDHIEKVQKTSKDRYGTDFPMQSDIVKETRQQTCNERFGKDSYTQTDEYWKERKARTFLERGVEHTSQDPAVREKYQKTLSEKYDGAKNMSEIPGVQQKITKTIFEKFGVPSALCLQHNRPYGKKEQEIREWLNSFGFNFVQDYSLLQGKEIDCYDSNNKIAFEYCGLYWHNEMSKTPRNMYYHYKKYKICKDQGVQLVTIFEDEWIYRENQCKNFIKSILGLNSRKIFARKCEITELDHKTFRNFCDAFHIQGSNNLTKVAFGLFYEKELVGVISMGRHPRKSSLLVMDRLCFKDDVSIAGGASKLFKKCVEYAKLNNINHIISWSDNRWSFGNVYSKLGFILDKKLKPDYSYVEYLKPSGRVSKQSQKKKQKCDKTEKELCLEKGLARIWDCGKIKWVYNIN